MSGSSSTVRCSCPLVVFRAGYLVSHAPDGYHNSVQVERAKLVSQIFDVDIHNIAGAIVFFLPDMSDDPISGEDLVLVPHQKFKNIELSPAERNYVFSDFAFPGDRVENKRSALQKGPFLLRTAPDECVNPRDKFPEIEGFDEIVIGTAVKAFHSVVDRILGGEHDRRGVFPVFPEFLNDLVAVKAGKHDVYDEAVIISASSFREAVIPVKCTVNGKTILGETLRENLYQVLVVFNNQNFHDLTLLLTNR
jgi:hypothetical protein